ncbi:CshA/CshB family fibrillar adhesin-related protein [Bifidobacterium sp. ESL0763]|uniref:CshA/CshB family fibrillar adhesin-related protein n=1 Tax=Bifidobacterium sp. ESL0763 TaxID=2983227 RepID=UPI0023F72121|nr:CshA/CshB family fibrillar adhesin-related protein [Bifidobacterium sp. ESL0763]MDF7663125.1 CshA/CshB family fibrillar adhesin-related protein [Bifidobacterium sp. ESL0763]
MLRPGRTKRLAAIAGAVAMSLTGAIGFATAADAAPAQIGAQDGVERSAASDGTGRLKDSINWIEWGSNDGEEIDGSRVAWTTPVQSGANDWIATRCDIEPSNDFGTKNPLSPSNRMKVYQPGDYYGDGLSQMYYQGGPGGDNTMKVGLANENDGDTVDFDFSCHAYLIDSGSAPTLAADTDTSGFRDVGLQGLVFADSESNNWTANSNYGQKEYIKAQPTESASGNDAPTWRLLDSYRTAGCTTNSVAELASDGTTMRFRSDGGQCANEGGTGPSSVMFLQNSHKAHVELKGGGVTAVALGSITAMDFGDAPTTYGTASSLFQPQWTGGKLGGEGMPGTPYAGDDTDPDNANAKGAQLYNLSAAKDASNDQPLYVANLKEPEPRLGAHEDSEAVAHPTADDSDYYKTSASWDDEHGDSSQLNDLSGKVQSDEDGIPADQFSQDGAVKVLPSADSTYKLKVNCAGTGNVKGWIDWNDNGTFDETTAAGANEASDQVACTAGSATLTWHVTRDAKRRILSEGTGSSYMRLRIAAPAAGTLEAKGLTTAAGEVEDYRADIHVPTLNVRTDIVGDRKNPTDQFKMTVDGDASNPGGAGDSSDATTEGTTGGIQGKQIAQKSVGPGFKYTIKDDLVSGNANDYKSSVTCVDLSKNPNAPVAIDNDGHLQMPPNDYDANVQCTYKKTAVGDGQLTLVTQVNNNHGGTAKGGDFTFDATPTPHPGTTPTDPNAPAKHYAVDSTAEGEDGNIASDSHTLDPDYDYAITSSDVPAGYSEVTPTSDDPNTVIDGNIAYTCVDADGNVCRPTFTDGKLDVQQGQHVTGTRIVEDQPAHLTLNTVVDNTYSPDGNDKSPSDFAFRVTPDGKSAANATKYDSDSGAHEMPAGKYTVKGILKDDDAHMLGWEQQGEITYTDDNTGAPLTAAQAQIALANGQSVTGTRKVRAQPGSLKVVTHVEGDGDAQPSDFPVTATPNGGNDTANATQLTDGTAADLKASNYKISTDMSGKPGYEVVDGKSLSCVTGAADAIAGWPGNKSSKPNVVPISSDDATLAMKNGAFVACEQTVKPKANPTLSFTTEVERGDAKPNDFTFEVTPTTGGGDSQKYTNGESKVPASHDFTVAPSTLPDGYVEDGDIQYYTDDDTAHANPMNLADAQQALKNGQSVTGVRKVTTHQPKLTVKVDRDYQYGGTAAGDGSKVTLKPEHGDGRDVTPDQAVYVAPGKYSVKQLLNAGYKQSDIKVALADGTPITIDEDGTFTVPNDVDANGNGVEVIVTIKNVDEPGTLTWSRYDEDGTTLLGGSEWELSGPDGQKIRVEDCTALECTGADKDPTPGKFKVTGLKWGDWTVTETKAPAGHQLTKPQTLRIDPSENGGDGSGLLKSASFKDGLPGLSSTGTDIASVALVAVLTLMLGMAVSFATRRMMDHKE